MTSCYLCGSRPTETAFPQRRIPTLPLLCLDCALSYASEMRREMETAERHGRPVCWWGEPSQEAAT